MVSRFVISFHGLLQGRCRRKMCDGGDAIDVRSWGCDQDCQWAHEQSVNMLDISYPLG